MGNAYDNASLIVTPNAYKASKIYALKPTDGSGDLSFSRAGSKMVRNSAGLWETIATNIPPLHYPVGGGCPSWLFEAEATNVVLNSLGNAATYSVAGGSSLSDFSLSTPFSGVTSAIKVSTIANFFSGCSKTISRASAINVNWCIVKKSTLDYMGMVDITGGGVVAWFNISNGTLGTVNAGYTARITSEGDGWYRCELTKNTADAAAVFQIMFTNTDNSSIGAVGDSYLCFVQNELGSTATSPIITAGSSVTRLADTSVTTGLSGIIGQTEGSVLLDFIPNSIDISGNIPIDLHDGTSDIYVYITGALAMSVDVVNSGVTVASISCGTAVIGTRYKIAIGYKTNDIAVYVNGSLAGTDTIASIPTLSTLSLGNYVSGTYRGSQIKDVILYETRLSNTELDELSTI